MPEIASSEARYHLGHYIVCVLDLLGQREKLKAWSIMPPDGKLTPPFQAGLKATIGAVMGLHEAFAEFFAAQRADTRLAPISDRLMSVEERGLYRRQKDFALGVAQFSDTFVFYARLSTAEGDLLVCPVYAILGACAAAMLMSLGAKCPLRGGVDIAPGIKIPELSFYGPALATAHWLEGTIAQYPRIVVSPSVVEFVQHVPAPTGCARVDEWVKDVLALCRNMLCPDGSDVIVDWLGTGVRDMLGYPNLDPKFWQALRQAHDFAGQSAEEFHREAESSEDQMKKQRAQTLAERYLRLYKYMVERLPKWGITWVDGTPKRR